VPLFSTVVHTLKFYATGKSIHISFSFLLNKPKASALWTTLTFWVLNVAGTVTVLTDYHAISSRVEDPLVLFSPLDKLLAFRSLSFGYASSRKDQKDIEYNTEI
jgi:hypothetical protein